MEALKRPRVRERPPKGRETLGEIRVRLGLNETELAVLFGISRLALAKWCVRGVPVERVADVDRVLELVRYLSWKVEPQRIPQIVRTPGKGLGGKTVLETIAERGALPVFAYLERLFSYAPG